GQGRSTGIASISYTCGATDVSLLLVVPEEGEGRDLNGDGDSFDSVYVLHDLATGVNTSLSLGTRVFDAGGVTADGHGALLVSEADQEADLNHDGDSDDAVLFVF